MLFINPLRTSYMHQLYFDHIQSPSQHLLQIQPPFLILLSIFTYYFFKGPFQNDVKMSKDDNGVEKRGVLSPWIWIIGCCEAHNMGACNWTWILYTPREILVFNWLSAMSLLPQLSSTRCYCVHLWCRTIGWHGWPIKGFTPANTDCSSLSTYLHLDYDFKDESLW